ncbi:serine/threonine protein kinase [Labrenzia suaedae]|uniref:Serine/threonine protein kinase n=1 Tax=Roseibium litorale TaxID=2803841 RepID=A0ABR9CLR9_9HYPH|nr:serine/threonine protein kinase [Roseibium litorale]
MPEHGTWINDKAAPKELTRLEIQTECVNNAVQVRVRAYTKCIPRDCKWGWTDGQAWPGGGIRVVLVGFFGSKQFDLRAVGDRMDAYVTNALHDPTQQETVKSYVLRRE